MDEALKLAEAPDLLKRTTEGERVWEMNQLAASLGPDWPDGELRSSSVKRRPFWKRPRLVREASDYLAATTAVINAASKPWPQVLDAMPTCPPRTSLDSMACELPMERAGQALAATRAGRVAIAVKRYRRRQGKLPASLTDLVAPPRIHSRVTTSCTGERRAASSSPAPVRREEPTHARLTRGAGRSASTSASLGLADRSAERARGRRAAHEATFIPWHRRPIRSTIPP